MEPILIKNFFGGISDSARRPSASEFQISKHFDIHTDPSKLTPYRDLAADTTTSVSATDLKQYFVRDFVYASASTKLYGLGQTGAGLTKILQKADATSGLWTTPATSEGNGAVKNGCFFEHANYLWGFQGTTSIFKWGLLSGSPSITNAVATVGATITSVANGVIAPATGEAYLAYNNVIVRISQDGATVTDSAKTVPTNLKITSLANFGSFLAIGCAPKDSYNGTSKVYLWNLSSNLFAETIEWGEGELRILENVDGILVGVSDVYLNNSVGAGRGSMIIKTYQGGAALPVKEILTKALTGKTIPLSKAVINGRLFFSAKIMTNTAGTTYNEGIWSFGRKNANYPYSLTLDVIEETVTTSGIQGFGSAANFFFIAHSNDGSVSKTSATETYTFDSIYESQVFDFGDSTVSKQIKLLTIYTDRITSGQSATLKFRVDGDTAWTTVGTISTVGVVSRDFYNIESSGADLPTFKEVEVRLESTGGAKITGFKITPKALIGSI